VADTFGNSLQTGAAALGVPLGEAALGALGLYAAELARWNRTINLVSREEDEGDWAERHFLDSLAPLATGLLGGGKLEVLDLGSGAGFPGLPLAVVRPGFSLFLAEGDARKCSFLRHIIRTLPVPGAQVLQGGFRDLGAPGSAGLFPPLKGKDAAGRFDLVVSRAAAQPDAIRDLALSFLRPGGRALLWVTDVPRETIGRIHPYTLPFSGRKAVIWEVEK
jgi:16S rRNA (guanine527-N7)-methyltransferase